MKKLLQFGLALLMAMSVGIVLPNTAEAASKPKKTNVTATRTDYNKAKLTFKKVSGVTGYKVYRSTKSASGYKLIKTTKSTSYTATVPAYNKTYYYKVKTYKGKNLSAYSNKVKVSKITKAQKDAIVKAKDILSSVPCSKSRLIELLVFKKVSVADATFAVNNMNANWNEQAYRTLLCIIALQREPLPASDTHYELMMGLTENFGFTEAQANYAIYKIVKEGYIILEAI